jgi:hypothetical protein
MTIYIFTLLLKSSAFWKRKHQPESNTLILSWIVSEKLGQQVANLTPHAPYSVSPLAFKMINDATEGAVISIHNQETLAEDQLYKTGDGDFLKLFQKFGMDNSPFPVTGQSSIRSYLPYFDRGQTIILCS